MNKSIKLFGKLLLGGVLFAAIGCTDLTEDIRQLENKVDNIVSGKIDPLSVDLEKAVSDLEAAKTAISELQATHAQDLKTLKEKDTELKGLIDSANESILALDNAIKTNASNIATLRSDMEKAVDAANNAIAELNTAVKNLQNKDTELENKLKSLSEDLTTLSTKVNNNEATLLDLVQKFTDYQATVDGKISKLETQVEALEGAVDKINKETIPGLEKLIDTNRENIEASLESFKMYANDQLEKLWLSDENILYVIGLLDGRVEKLEEIAESLQKQITDNYGEFTTFKGKVNGQLQSLNSTLNGHLEAYEKLVKDLNAEIQNRKDKDDELEGLINTLNDETIPAIEGKIKDANDRIDALEEAFDDYKTEIKKYVDAAAQGVQDNLDEFIETVQSSFEDLQVKIDAAAALAEQLQIFINKTIGASIVDLINRIQSVVYVPETKDMAAHVEALVPGQYSNSRANDTAVEDETGAVTVKSPFVGKPVVTMLFQVQPVESAEAILTAWQKDPSSLGFYIVELKSEEVPSLDITNVELVEAVPGRLAVTANVNVPANKNIEDYAVALKYYSTENKYKFDGENDVEVNNDITSNFVKLALDTKLFNGLVIGTLTEGGEFVPDPDGPAHELPYTRDDTTIVVFKDYEVRIEVIGETTEYLEIEDVKSLFGVETTGPEFAHQAFNNAGQEAEDAAANFKVENDQDVSLVAILKETVGNRVEVTETYTCDGIKYDFVGTVTIVKDYNSATFEPVVKVWNYAEYKLGPTEYNGLAYEFTTKFATELKDHEHIAADVATYWPSSNHPKAYSKYDAKDESKCVVAEGVTVTFVEGDKEAYTFEIEGYEYGKTYTVVLEEDFSTTTFHGEFEITFVNLPEEIVYNYGAAEFKYNIDDIWFKLEPKSAVEDLFAETALPEKYADEKPYFADQAEFLEYVNMGIDQVYAPVIYNTKMNGEVLANHPKPSNVHAASPEGTELIVSFAGLDKVYPQIKSSTITAEDDSFEFSDTVKTHAGMNIVLNAEAQVVMPDYKVVANPLYTYYANDVWNTDAHPNYNPNSLMSSAVKEFKVDALDLRDAFYVMEGDKMIVPSEYEEYGITMNFAIPEGFEVENAENGGDISISGGHIMTYNGSNDSTPVNGTLMVEGIVLKAAFSEFDNNYQVNKFDPFISTGFSAEVPIYTAIGQAEYEELAFINLSLYDKRLESPQSTSYVKGYDLINHNAKKLEDVWVIGNGDGDDANPANGFAVEEPVNKIYHIDDAIKMSLGDIYFVESLKPAKKLLQENLKFDETTGIVKFSGLNELRLVEDVKVVINAKISYPWGTQTGTITYTLKKGNN